MDKQITLITGTRKGIGKFLVNYYLQKGHMVIGCSRTEPDWKAENYEHIICDVSNEDEVKKVFVKIKQKYKKLDNLINNAGMASMNHTLLTPLSTVENLIKTNLIGTFLFCREGAKLMSKNRFGRIVNFSTVAVPLKLEGEAIYAATKSAVVTLTHILAKEFAYMNITVNAIGPTPIHTDLIKNVPQEKLDILLNSQAIKRFGEFEDVANVIDFYLSKNSDFITGQVVYLGGV